MPQALTVHFDDEIFARLMATSRRTNRDPRSVVFFALKEYLKRTKNGTINPVDEAKLPVTDPIDSLEGVERAILFAVSGDEPPAKIYPDKTDGRR